MKDWIKFGLVAALIVSVSDLLRKHIVKSVDHVITVLLTLCVAGLLSLVILSTDKYKKIVTDMSQIQYCVLLGIGLMVPIGHYFITKTIQGVHNPGYAKVIISLNILVSLFASLVLFSESKINKYTVLGTFLVLGGSCLIATKA